MKYNESNKPYVCMQTQNACYNGSGKMEIKGVLWHSTAANNPALKRYLQPSDIPDKRDTITLERIGKNVYGNDWNHNGFEGGMNCWIGQLADGTVTTIQTMPWNCRPWGCNHGWRGSCNDGWIQFEICEDDLTSKTYFDAIYKEACEITAYLCKLHSIDPYGIVDFKGAKVPTIICHQDSYKLGLGSNHADVYHWFTKYGKSMETARKDVAALLAKDKQPIPESTAPAVVTYSVVTKINKYSTASDAKSQKNSEGTLEAGTYYIYSKYPNGYNGMYNISTDKTGKSAGSWINPAENVVQKPTAPPAPTPVYDLDFPEQDLIVDKSIARTETDCVKAIQKIMSNNDNFDVEIAKAFWRLAPKYNIDPMMAIAQSVLETGWFKFVGSSVSPEQHNYCGLGATGNGAAGGKFDTIEDGVTAQLQHLFAYGCKDVLDETIIDPRFKYVTRGIAPYWQQLAGRWAFPGYDKNTYDTPEKAVAANQTYGQIIRSICNKFISVTVTDADVEKYFPKEPPVSNPVETPEEKPVENPTADTPSTDIEDTPVSEKGTSSIGDIIMQVLRVLLEALMKFFRKETK